MHDDEVDEIMHRKKTGSKMRTPLFLHCMYKTNMLFMLLDPLVELFVSLVAMRETTSCHCCFKPISVKDCKYLKKNVD